MQLRQAHQSLEMSHVPIAHLAVKVVANEAKADAREVVKEVSVATKVDVKMRPATMQATWAMRKLKCPSMPTPLPTHRLTQRQPLTNAKRAQRAHPRNGSVVHAIVMVVTVENAIPTTTTQLLKMQTLKASLLRHPTQKVQAPLVRTLTVETHSQVLRHLAQPQHKLLLQHKHQHQASQPLHLLQQKRPQVCQRSRRMNCQWPV
jgi:hypothetical protein